MKRHLTLILPRVVVTNPLEIFSLVAPPPPRDLNHLGNLKYIFCGHSDFRRMELKLGMRVGGGPPMFESIFLKRRHLRLKVIQGQSALEMPYSYQIWSKEPLTRA